jgi:hypothetical protein
MSTNDHYFWEAADSIADGYLELARDAEMSSHEILVISELARLMLQRIVAPNNPESGLQARREAEAILKAACTFLGDN